MLSLIYLVLNIFICVDGIRHPSCLDENGHPVDYFFSMKAPAGFQTYFSDGSHPFKVSKYGIEGHKGAVPYTLKQVYKKMPSSHAYAMYNDQAADGKSLSAHAHAKGVVFFDKVQGFWLIHSMPKYPNVVKDGYGELPDHTFGQSFMCITLPTEALDAIGDQLLIAYPQFYDAKMTSDLVNAAPLFASVALHNKRNRETESQEMEFTSLNGVTFNHFVKGKSCDCLLWEDIVSPNLESDLKVQSWMNGREDNKVPSSCKSKGFDYNIEDVSLVKQVDGTKWKESHDHSKWAVSEKDFETVCVGDMNRQYSQSKRGGGSMCIKNKVMWKAYNSMIAKISHPCR